jgi:hypothetical protein
MKILIKDWSELDRSLKAAEAESEQRRMHEGVPKTERFLGRFSDVSREIYHDEQPSFYIKALSVIPGAGPGGRALPVAIVELSSSTDYDPTSRKWAPKTLRIDISEAVKTISKNARNKALRYGKPLPGPDQLEVEKIVAKAVMAERARKE